MNIPFKAYGVCGLLLHLLQLLLVHQGRDHLPRAAGIFVLGFKQVNQGK